VRRGRAPATIRDRAHRAFIDGRYSEGGASESEQDLENLDFAVAHVDMVGFSFVQSAGDISALQEQLAQRAGPGRTPAIVAKIETARAVRNLPEISVQAAGRQPFKVNSRA
jgi:pyruvate kinase